MADFRKEGRPCPIAHRGCMEAAAVNFDGIYIVAIDHGGPWLKDKQRTEKWSTEAAMDGVKRSFEAALLAGYDLIHVDPTVDINVPAGQTIIELAVAANLRPFLV